MPRTAAEFRCWAAIICGVGLALVAAYALAFAPWVAGLAFVGALAVFGFVVPIAYRRAYGASFWQAIVRLVRGH